MFRFGISVAWLDYNLRNGRPPILNVNYRCGCWQTFYDYGDGAGWKSEESGPGHTHLCRLHQHVAVLGGDVEVIYDYDAEIRTETKNGLVQFWRDRFDIAMRGEGRR